MKNLVLACLGPTAVGKTKIAIQLANKLNGEIVNCDSMQIYRGLDIGTAKPTPEDQEKAIHHLIDFVDPASRFTVADYQKLALEKIRGILERDRLPIVTGGTGLYLNSLVYDMDFSETKGDEKLRSKLYELLDQEGPYILHKKLRDLDPEVAERIHPHNARRVIRAIEVLKTQGQMDDFSKLKKKNSEFDFYLTALVRDRKEVYERINLRVDEMIAEGLITEVNNLLLAGLDYQAASMQGIGYKEVVPYIKNEYDFERMVYLIKRNTRRFAKRQLTWLRRYNGIDWFNLSEMPAAEAIQRIENKLKMRLKENG